MPICASYSAAAVMDSGLPHPISGSPKITGRGFGARARRARPAMTPIKEAVTQWASHDAPCFWSRDLRAALVSTFACPTCGLVARFGRFVMRGRPLWSSCLGDAARGDHEDRPAGMLNLHCIKATDCVVGKGDAHEHDARNDLGPAGTTPRHARAAGAAARGRRNSRRGI